MKKVKPNFTGIDSVVFSQFLVDLNQFKEIGRYAAWLVFDLSLKNVKVIQKFEYEPKYEELSHLVNNPQFKVTNMEIQKILNGLQLVKVNEDSQSLTWIGPDIFNIVGLSYQDLKQMPHL